MLSELIKWKSRLGAIEKKIIIIMLYVKIFELDGNKWPLRIYQPCMKIIQVEWKINNLTVILIK